MKCTRVNIGMKCTRVNIGMNTANSILDLIQKWVN